MVDASRAPTGECIEESVLDELPLLRLLPDDARAWAIRRFVADLVSIRRGDGRRGRTDRRVLRSRLRPRSRRQAQRQCRRNPGQRAARAATVSEKPSCSRARRAPSPFAPAPTCWPCALTQRTSVRSSISPGHPPLPRAAAQTCAAPGVLPPPPVLRAAAAGSRRRRGPGRVRADRAECRRHRLPAG